MKLATPCSTLSITESSESLSPSLQIRAHTSCRILAVCYVVPDSQQACLEREYTKSKVNLTGPERQLRKLAISFCHRDIVRMRDYEGMLAWFKSRIAHLS